MTLNAWVGMVPDLPAATPMVHVLRAHSVVEAQIPAEVVTPACKASAASPVAADKPVMLGVHCLIPIIAAMASVKSMPNHPKTSKTVRKIVSRQRAVRVAQTVNHVVILSQPAGKFVMHTATRQPANANQLLREIYAKVER